MSEIKKQSCLPVTFYSKASPDQCLLELVQYQVNQVFIFYQTFVFRSRDIDILQLVLFMVSEMPALISVIVLKT